jgi:predicted PurR-regulated permease PerM
MSGAMKAIKEWVMRDLSFGLNLVIIILLVFFSVSILTKLDTLQQNQQKLHDTITDSFQWWAQKWEQENKPPVVQHPPVAHHHVTVHHHLVHHHLVIPYWGWR